MSFVAKLQRAREGLEQQGRLSVRALGRELELGGEELDELVEELVDKVVNQSLVSRLMPRYRNRRSRCGR